MKVDLSTFLGLKIDAALKRALVLFSAQVSKEISRLNAEIVALKTRIEELEP